jgi:hypothetical protein
MAAALPSPAAAALVIENDFTGTGPLKITLEQEGIKDVVECTGSTLKGTASSPPDAKAKLSSWTMTGCTASSGGESFGSASVTALYSLPAVKAVSTAWAEFGPLTVRAEYKVHGSTCRPEVIMSDYPYNYTNGSSTNQLAASVPHIFTIPEGFPPPECLSDGLGYFEPSFTFTNPQFEVADFPGPYLATGVTTAGKIFARNINPKGWVDITPSGITATSVSGGRDASNGPLIGIVGSNGHAYVKQKTTGVWIDQFAGAKSISVATDSKNGPLIGIVATDGKVYAKQGLSSAWVEIYAGAKSIDVATDSTNGPVIGILANNEKAYAKQGLSGAWNEEYAGAQSITVASDLTTGPVIGVIGNNEKAYAKKGLTGVWNEEFVGAKSIDVATDSTNGPVIGLIANDGRAYAKTGLTGAWVEESTGAKVISIASGADVGRQIGIIANDGHAYVKQGLTGAWVDELSGIQGFAIAN